MKKKLLITGINGYLGSKLAYRYKGEYEVIGLEYDLTNLHRLEEGLFEVYESKKGIPDDLFDNHQIDIIIHTGTFYGRDNESSSKMLYANTYLPQLLLVKAVANNCELFINTDTVLNRFTSSYSLTKKQFRDWLQFYANQQKIKVINIRLEHFYGPGTSDTNFVTLMVRKMLNNEANIALTKAEQRRDFLYIDDLLNVYDLMLDKHESMDILSEFQVGFGKNIQLKDLLELIKRSTKSISNLCYGEIAYRNNELMESSNDINTLLEIGWVPKIGIEEGLLEVIEYEKAFCNRNH